MQLMLNDKAIEVESNITISQLIDWLRIDNGFSDTNFAIAVNMEFVPRSIYSESVLQENDKVEIVLPMQGG
ncbi:sulfur carrier protein ThiS [Kangiella sp. HZ709]|uniref:sulfur carrier protein ThiS n=1 Tax=Kangiella sp. HZ709 TaxID=2666328 RepID=UPI0012AF496A|nr:sulfur carrier protein ThiS [Kangiella sp. HZ709]MRX27993.1 sulfur carrier protein ThiS [Kangiella sp. HZ709]